MNDKVFKADELTNLSQEIIRQNGVKKDFIINTEAEGFKFGLTRGHLGYGEVKPIFQLEGYDDFDITEHTHNQVAQKLQIPKRYYDKMRVENPDLLAENVNSWFNKNNSKVMVRTIDNSARAFVSSRYRPLDNYDLMNAILPVLKDQQMSVKQSALTEQRLYLKTTFPGLQREVKVNDVVEAGLIISNSEVGAGALKIEAMIWRLVCSNGMITAASLRKYHVGRGNGNGDTDISEFFSDRTRELDDASFFSKVQDICRASIREENFDKEVMKLQESTERKIEKSIPKVVEITSEKFGLTDGEKDDALHELIKSGDLTQYGLANAVTRVAQISDRYDRQVELERIGNGIIELKPTDWKTVALN